MRTKKWARPELAVCPFYIKEPWAKKDKWNQAFSKEQPIWLELGCGKGGFLTQFTSARPDINFLGIDMISDMLGVARRKIQESFDERGLPVANLLLTSWDIARIDMILGKKDTVERIFINFCNPWFKPRQYKKRMTHPTQLQKYRKFLKDDGEIWFKTDDDELFNHSLKYFSENGFLVTYQTMDLHQSGFSPNYLTEHEEMFSNEGVKIKFAIVKKLPDAER